MNGGPILQDKQAVVTLVALKPRKTKMDLGQDLREALVLFRVDCSVLDGCLCMIEFY